MESEQKLLKDWKEVKKELFEDKDFIPTISITTDKDLETEVKFDDISYQKGKIEQIFINGSCAPVFKQNRKYCIGKFESQTPYIAYDDVMGNKFIIRGRPSGSPFNSFDNEKRVIIVEYQNSNDLVNDGWRLD